MGQKPCGTSHSTDMAPAGMDTRDVSAEALSTLTWLLAGVRGALKAQRPTQPPRFPQSHEGVCPQESVYCENKCGARMMRRLLAQHATSECPKRTQPCTYCTKEFVFDTIQVRPFLSPGGGRGARSRESGR